MKKYVIALFLVFFMAGFAAAQLRAGGTMFISVNNLQLKSGTGFFASNRGAVNYGDRVTVVRIDGRFAEVRTTGTPVITGWTASANLSARQLVAGTTSTATAREVALAGKGFNAEVEQSYREQNRALNYADVDRVEAISVNMEELRRFLEQGRLAMGE